MMTRDELNALFKEYIKDNLTIDIRKVCEYESRSIQVRLCIEGDIISEDYVTIDRN